MGHVNHRGWIVLLSVPSGDGSLCVDLFEDPAGGFGFEHFRADVDGGAGFVPIGAFSATRYESADAAIAAARRKVRWLETDPLARGVLDDWHSRSP